LMDELVPAKDDWRRLYHAERQCRGTSGSGSRPRPARRRPPPRRPGRAARPRPSSPPTGRSRSTWAACRPLPGTTAGMARRRGGAVKRPPVGGPGAPPRGYVNELNARK
jgi:hypothetical protein